MFSAYESDETVNLSFKTLILLCILFKFCCIINCLQNIPLPLDNSKCHPGVIPGVGRYTEDQAKEFGKKTFLQQRKKLMLSEEIRRFGKRLYS